MDVAKAADCLILGPVCGRRPGSFVARSPATCLFYRRPNMQPPAQLNRGPAHPWPVPWPPAHPPHSRPGSSDHGPPHPSPDPQPPCSYAATSTAVSTAKPPLPAHQRISLMGMKNLGLYNNGLLCDVRIEDAAVRSPPGFIPLEHVLHVFS